MNKILDAIQRSSSEELFEFCNAFLETNNVSKPNDEKSGTWIDCSVGDFAEDLLSVARSKKREAENGQ